MLAGVISLGRKMFEMSSVSSNKQKTVQGSFLHGNEIHLYVFHPDIQGYAHGAGDHLRHIVCISFVWIVFLVEKRLDHFKLTVGSFRR